MYARNANGQRAQKTGFWLRFQCVQNPVLGPHSSLTVPKNFDSMPLQGGPAMGPFSPKLPYGTPNFLFYHLAQIHCHFYITTFQKQLYKSAIGFGLGGKIKKLEGTLQGKWAHRRTTIQRDRTEIFLVPLGCYGVPERDPRRT